MSAAINTYYSRPEQIEITRKIIADVMGGHKPTTKQTDQIWKEAKELLAWMDGEWAKVQNGRVSKDEYCRTLEDLFYRHGHLRLFWGLATDDAKLWHFVEESHRLAERAEQAGAPVIAAITKAASREQEEWQILARAANDLSYQAGLIQSQRLENAANVLRAMLVPERLEPEAPGKAAHEESGRKGGQSRRAKSNAARKELKRRYLAGIPDKWKTPTEAARALMDDALTLGAIRSRERGLQTLGDWFREAARGDMK